MQHLFLLGVPDLHATSNIFLLVESPLARIIFLLLRYGLLMFVVQGGVAILLLNTYIG